MARAERRVALASMSPAIAQDDGVDLSSMSRPTLDRFPSYGVRRVQAALVADRELDADVALFDLPDASPEELLEKIEAFDPDVLALATYVWSTPTMIAIARAMKRRHPQCLVVFGGPSSHPD